MAKNNKLTLCYPYGMGSTCICDGRGGLGVIYRCFHSLEALRTDDHDLTGEALLNRDSENGLPGGNPDDLTLDSITSFGSRGLDEKTEIILAATFLVLIILAFISFVIYRCEKNYMRRRLQESFHLTPSGAAGFFSNPFGHHLHGNGGHPTIPSISVSVQTEPSMGHMNGGGGNTNLAHTNSLMGNGVGSAGLFQNGVNSNPNGVLANANERAPPGNYATLPHPSHHHLQSIHVDADQITQHWSRDNLLTASYDVNLSTFACHNNSNGGTGPKVAGPVHSRENTLSRDIHHITDRDYALRSSVTAENLRSPSVAGTHGRDDDDLNTDYAESDVMLGGAPSSNSNNGSNNNSTEEGGGRNSNNNPRY